MQEKEQLVKEVVNEVFIILDDMLSRLYIDNFDDFKRIVSVKADAARVDKEKNNGQD